MFERAKNWWKRQPEIRVFQPIIIENNPAPLPFKVIMEGKKIEGLLLRKDDLPRKMSKKGPYSFGLSPPKNWVEHLKPPFKAFLIQVQDKIGIVFMPEERENK